MSLPYIYVLKRCEDNGDHVYSQLLSTWAERTMNIFSPGERFISVFLIIYFLECARTSQELEIPCPDLPNCDCSKVFSDTYDLTCPKVGNPSLSVRVYTPAFIYINCNPSTQVTDYEYLKGMNVGSVAAVHIKEHCPLPNTSIAELLQAMGIQITNTLAFKGPIPLKDSLKNKHFTGLPMEHLILLLNGITALPENFFEGLPNLTSFDLGVNKIRYLPKNIFKPVASKLKIIDLGQNKLENLDDGIFANLTEINKINIRGNELKELSRNIFSGLTTLDDLDFSQNHLETLPVDIFRDLKNLSKLQMDENNFSEIPEIFTSDFPKLKEFSLETNKQQIKFPDYFFSNLTGLERVRLNHNHLSSIPEKCFWKCPSITSIGLLESSFKSLPQDLFRDSVNLEWLDLAFNQLEQLPDYIFKNLGKLAGLRLDSNRLQSLSRNVFHGLKNLKKLDLQNNFLSYVDGEAFLPLQQLQVITLYNNSITFKNENLNQSRHESPLKYCNNLEKIYLDTNYIDEVFIDWRLNLTKLNYLDVRSNNVQHLSVNDIYFLSSLVMVDLRYNNISVFDFQNVEALSSGLWSTYPPRQNESVFDFYNDEDLTAQILWAGGYDWAGPPPLRKAGIVRLKLAENPVHCDCRSYDFFRYLDEKNWPKVNLTFYADDFTCEEPEGLEGVLAKNINLKELICPAGEKCPRDCGKEAF